MSWRAFARRFETREEGHERLNDPDVATREFEKTLADFRITNLVVSRARFLLARHVLAHAARTPDRPRHLIDIGAGGCDTAAWLVAAARKRGLRLRVSAVDNDPRAVTLARRWFGGLPDLSIIRGDLRDLDRLAPADYVYCNHVLHHLPEADLETLLAGLPKIGTAGILLNDLARSPWAYAAFLAFASPAFGRRSITVEDGLVSIRRAYAAPELEALARRAAVPPPPYRVLRLFPARLVLVRGFA